MKEDKSTKAELRERVFRQAVELAELRTAAHHLLNVTTNPPEVERPLRKLLYGEAE